jgi:sensor histidine kinase YesM
MFQTFLKLHPSWIHSFGQKNKILMNLNLSKFQKIEIGFFLLITCFYLQKQLYYAVFDFDYSITQAEAIPGMAAYIWLSLSNFDYNFNVIVPTITAAFLYLSAWMIFHFWVAPKYMANPQSWRTLGFQIGLSFGLVLASVLIFKYFRLYPVLKLDSNQQIIGMRVVSIYRKLFVVTDTLFYALAIVLYEVIYQFVLHNYRLYQAQKQLKHFFLSLVVGSVMALFLLTLATSLHLPNVVFKDTRGLWAIIIFITNTAIVFRFSNQYVLPFINKHTNTLLGQYALFGLTLAFTFVFFAMLHSFNQSIEFAKYGSYVYPKNDWIEFSIYQLGFIPSILGLVISKIRSYYLEETEQLQTQVFNKSAELSGLRSQINPHFLFNALNTLYSVALLENANKTADGIQKLGDMMRFMLQENHQERIPLSKEVAYLENFIEIQKMRLDLTNQIEIRVNIQVPEHEIFIAPMLLNPFVENAFKHGISLRAASWIYITLTLDATQLYFKVHNSLHPKPEIDAEHSFGVGLENVKKRLELIYPNRHKLDIQASNQDFFVSLTLGLW